MFTVVKRYKNLRDGAFTKDLQTLVSKSHGLFPSLWALETKKLQLFSARVDVKNRPLGLSPGAARTDLIRGSVARLPGGCHLGIFQRVLKDKANQEEFPTGRVHLDLGINSFLFFSPF